MRQRHLHLTMVNAAGVSKHRCGSGHLLFFFAPARPALDEFAEEGTVSTTGAGSVLPRPLAPVLPPSHTRLGLGRYARSIPTRWWSQYMSCQGDRMALTNNHVTNQALCP